MPGNCIGKTYCVTTFGESHGPSLGGIIDGVPPGMSLSTRDIQVELDKRRPGQSRYTSKRNEPDAVEILSGVFEGKTTGTSIGLIVRNVDQRSKDYSNVRRVYRPGHADYGYSKKYGLRDYRGGGRASARETVIRVAAGAIAKKYLREHHRTNVRGYLSQLGNIACPWKSWSEVERNRFFCADAKKVDALRTALEELTEKGNSIGAKVTVVVDNVPVGLGEPVFDKLDADLAHALMSINAVKGIEIGDGFSVVAQKGSENRDEMDQQGFSSNRSGGILGGISNGQNIVIHLAFKPTSSVVRPIWTLDESGARRKITVQGRHDPCVGIRGVPIAESMTAIVLMDHVLRHRAQCG